MELLQCMSDVDEEKRKLERDSLSCVLKRQVNLLSHF